MFITMKIKAEKKVFRGPGTRERIHEKGTKYFITTDEPRAMHHYKRYHGNSRFRSHTASYDIHINNKNKK